MGSEQGRHHRSRPAGGGLADRFQRLQFRFEASVRSLTWPQPWSCHAQPCPSSVSDLRRQGALSRLANTFKARSNAAASGCDLLVRSAFDAFLKIHQPWADKDRMRVRIDEAGKDNFARAVDLGAFPCDFSSATGRAERLWSCRPKRSCRREHSTAPSSMIPNSLRAEPAEGRTP